MYTPDLMLKFCVSRTAVTKPRLTLNNIALNTASFSDYLLRVVNANITDLKAVREAALSDGRPQAKQIAAIIDAWVSPLFTGIPNATSLDVPAFLPTSIGQPAGTIIVENTNDFPTAGRFRIQSSHGEQIISYTGKMQGQDFGSFTGCTGGNGGSAGQGNVITEVPDYDISPSAVKARRDTFIAAFTRRSQNAIGALNFINDKHIWSWKPPLAE